MDKNDTLIEYNPLNKICAYVHRTKPIQGSVDGGISARFVDKKTKEQSRGIVDGMTKNEATFLLFCDDALNAASFLDILECPEKLLNTTWKISKAIFEFHTNWLKMNLDDKHFKAARYKNGIKILMPEV